jgi:hypothetical protein
MLSNAVVNSAESEGDDSFNVKSECEPSYKSKMKTLQMNPPPIPPRLFSTPNKTALGKNTNLSRKANDLNQSSDKDTVTSASIQLQRLAISEQIDDDIGDSDDLVIFDK